jgi:hypothetical protein
VPFDVKNREDYLQDLNQITPDSKMAFTYSIFVTNFDVSPQKNLIEIFERAIKNKEKLIATDLKG